MRSPRESLRELDLLMMQAEPITTALGAFLADHVTLMAAILGLTEHEIIALTTLPDEPLVFYLGPALRQHRLRQKENLATRKFEQRSQVITPLSSTARWQGERVALDAHLLLELLKTGAQKFVLFSSAFFEVLITRSKLRELSKALGHRDDLLAIVDQLGLHVHWRQGKGRLLLYPQLTKPLEHDMLLVPLVGVPNGHVMPTAAE